MALKVLRLENSFCSPLVDADVYEWAKQYHWRISPDGYVCRHSDGTISLASDVIGKPPKGKEIDHCNQNKLDNRRQNLRFVTRQQNAWNRPKPKRNKTGFLGVSIWGDRFCVWVRHNGNTIYHKTFDDPILAAKAYDREIVRCRGEFAITNFPMRFPRAARFPRESKNRSC